MGSATKKKTKENRSDWVAVESEVSGTGVKIEKARTAFQFFQKKVTPIVREELAALVAAENEEDGSNLTIDLGSIQKEISSRWNQMPDSEKQEFLDLATKDRERYDAECLKRDEEVILMRRQKQEEREASVDGKRERKPHQIVKEKTKSKKDLTEDQIEAKKLQDEFKMHLKEEKEALRGEESRQKEEIKQKKAEAASARLQYLLSQSDIFSHFGGTMQDIQKKESSNARKRLTEQEEDQSLLKEKHDSVRLTKQPSGIKFGTMRDYQVEGLNWMINSANRGINGILADEMGLGKTLQTISILAYNLEVKNVSGPHIVLVPKSTLSNWLNEFKRWCPSLRAIKFHGKKDERQSVINDILCPGLPDRQRKFDVCVTTFEMCIKEKGVLGRFGWRYLVIDEAHRIKNEASQFAVVVRSFLTEHRLLLTGTPLQNNLHELWALLNFLIPDVFSSADQFDDWFNLEVDDEEAKKKMIHQLHRILRPFMLRRLKADVEKSLPPKKETLLFVGMSEMQKNLYKSLLMRDMDAVTGNSSNRTALLNIVMQLRKCCGHPYLFEGQEDRTLDPMGEHLVNNCGKLVLLDKLLKKLKERGSRVLIFSQMTRVLDILEDFCRMRAYEYCRIDGQTSYEGREDSIDSFNAEGSSKFCFLLSTRAGGLGINLATADTVILYDSDWNPQADLQAQDRAHRIGQKKEVNVYRLITGNSVEEKIIERAQQKLKLDAMVVQQGRLQEKNKALSKDEMLEMIRFGADQVFRASGSEITDDDIDAILAQGEARTEEMKEKLQAHDKGDLLDFKLDGGDSVQVHDGVDYSKEKERAEELKRLADAEFAMQLSEGMGKRERRPVANYNLNNYYRQADSNKKKRKQLPKTLRLPKMDEWQFYNRQRILEINEIECAEYEETKDIENPPPTFLPPELEEEKQLLLNEAFRDWNKQHFYTFVKSSTRHGRNDIVSIARDLGKDVDEVGKYSKTFWERGSELSDWERIVKNIEKGESKLMEIKKLSEETAKKVSRYSNPWEMMTMNYQGKQGKVYTEEEDRYLLCLTHRHGYGAWEKVKQDIFRSDRFLFDYYLRSRSAAEIGRRCEFLMKCCEKDNVDADIKESKDREIIMKIQNEREALDLRIEEAKKNLRIRQSELNDLILQEASKIQQRKEMKNKWKNRLKIEKKVFQAGENTVDRVFGALLRFIQSSTQTDVHSMALSFSKQYDDVSAEQVANTIREIAQLKEKGENVKWIIMEQYMNRIHEQPQSPRKRKLSDDGNNNVSKKIKLAEKMGSAVQRIRLPGPKSFGKSGKKNKKEKKDKNEKEMKKKKVDDGINKPTPKRARSAYVLFSLAKRNEVKAKIPSNAGIVELMAKLTAMWKSMNDDEKHPWVIEAEKDLDRYNREVAALENANIA